MGKKVDVFGDWVVKAVFGAAAATVEAGKQVLAAAPPNIPIPTTDTLRSVVGAASTVVTGAEGLAAPVIQAASEVGQTTFNILDSPTGFFLLNDYYTYRLLTDPAYFRQYSTNLTSMSGENLKNEYDDNNQVIHKYINEQKKLIQNKARIDPKEFSDKLDKSTKVIKDYMDRNKMIFEQCEKGTSLEDIQIAAAEKAPLLKDPNAEKQRIDYLKLNKLHKNKIIEEYPKDLAEIQSELQKIRLLELQDQGQIQRQQMEQTHASANPAQSMTSQYEREASTQKSVSAPIKITPQQLEAIQTQFKNVEVTQKENLVLASRDTSELCGAARYLSSQHSEELSFALNAPNLNAAIEVFEQSQKQAVKIGSITYKDDKGEKKTIEGEEEIQNFISQNKPSSSKPLTEPPKSGPSF